MQNARFARKDCYAMVLKILPLLGPSRELELRPLPRPGPVAKAALPMDIRSLVNPSPRNRLEESPSPFLPVFPSDMPSMSLESMLVCSRFCIMLVMLSALASDLPKPRLDAWALPMAKALCTPTWAMEAMVKGIKKPPKRCHPLA